LNETCNTNNIIGKILRTYIEYHLIWCQESHTGVKLGKKRKNICNDIDCKYIGCLGGFTHCDISWSNGNFFFYNTYK